MAIYRTTGDQNFKNYGKTAIEAVSPMEWADEMEVSRIDEDSWVQRYRYEAEIIGQICIENGYRKILELGSGPGLLSQYVMEKVKDANYSFVDKETSRKIFQKRGFKGNKFHVKDLMHFFDISDLDTDYDLIIANDFLEHIADPSHVMCQCREITKQNSGFFISVPNWRMNHEFIYRGLFDYDNFVYFCRIHGWNPSEIAGSILKCEYRPKLSSEESLPDDLIDSWNWYFYCEKLS